MFSSLSLLPIPMDTVDFVEMNYLPSLCYSSKLQMKKLIVENYKNGKGAIVRYSPMTAL